MINFKSFKWSYGVAISFVLGLSGCYMDGRNPQNIDYSAQNHRAPSHTGESMSKAHTPKHASSKEPIQKSTPGPKQVTAPQLPVIQ